jgi:hypothetical protein
MHAFTFEQVAVVRSPIRSPGEMAARVRVIRRGLRGLGRAKQGLGFDAPGGGDRGRAAAAGRAAGQGRTIQVRFTA